MNHRSMIVLAALCWALPARPHHNAAAHYLVNESISIEGVVTEFRMVNPHARIYLNVTKSNGTVESWMAEGTGAAVLQRRGWNAQQFAQGERIKIIGHPARDYSHIIEWTSITLANGTQLGGGNGLAEERREFLDELDKRRQAGRPPAP